MKIRVSYTVEVDDDYRRALAYRWGDDGLASRADMKRHFEMVGSSEDADIMQDWQDEEAAR